MKRQASLFDVTGQVDRRKIARVNSAKAHEAEVNRKAVAERLTIPTAVVSGA
jgi:hypothetical protein